MCVCVCFYIHFSNVIRVDLIFVPCAVQIFKSFILQIFIHITSKIGWITWRIQIEFLWLKKWAQTLYFQCLMAAKKLIKVIKNTSKWVCWTNINCQKAHAHHWLKIRKEKSCHSPKFNQKLIKIHSKTTNTHMTGDRMVIWVCPLFSIHICM